MKTKGWTEKDECCFYVVFMFKEVDIFFNG